jgi:hypothetical protein
MTTQAIFDEGIANELLAIGFPAPHEMDIIEVNDESLFFLGFLWKLPLGTVSPFNGLDFLLGCRKLVSARRIECVSARPVHVGFEYEYRWDVDVLFWDTDGPLPSRNVVLDRVLQKIHSLTGETGQ